MSQQPGTSWLEKIVCEISEKRFLPSITKYKLIGKPTSGLSTHQEFTEIRNECLAKGQLFEDPDFELEKSPANRHDVTAWLRPGEICKNPQFIVNEYNRFDVQQGELGDCWVIAAMANLTLHKDLFSQVVPDDQDFDKYYAGIFHFRFWQYGYWVDVIIDDRLPTYEGQLIFVKSQEKNEFWSALLEKAYAKLNGSYGGLKAGLAIESMQDFTGGVTEKFNVSDFKDIKTLSKMLIKAYERNSLMACAINKLKADPGLLINHAYSITGIQYMTVENSNILLIRLRNPWGNQVEWNGSWSDKSPEWRNISATKKEEMGFVCKVDGEFYMSFADFIKNFNRIDICNLPGSLDNRNCRKWECAIFKGVWVKGLSAGGCTNKGNPFWRNPQYIIILKDVDDDDDQCTLIVALLQRNRRPQRLEVLPIGFCIFKLPENDRIPKPLDENFILRNNPVGKLAVFNNYREVTGRFKLQPRRYVILPSTFEPDMEVEFLLRVFAEKPFDMEEYKKL